MVSMIMRPSLSPPPPSPPLSLSYSLFLFLINFLCVYYYALPRLTVDLEDLTLCLSVSKDFV